MYERTTIMSNNNEIAIPSPQDAEGYGPHWDEIVAVLTDKIIKRSIAVVEANYNGEPVFYDMHDPNFRKDNVHIRAMADAQLKLADAGWMMVEAQYYQPLTTGYQPRNDGSTVLMRIESLVSYNRKEEARWAKAKRHTKMVRWLKRGLLLAFAGLICVMAYYLWINAV